MSENAVHLSTFALSEELRRVADQVEELRTARHMRTVLGEAARLMREAAERLMPGRC